MPQTALLGKGMEAALCTCGQLPLPKCTKHRCGLSSDKHPFGERGSVGAARIARAGQSVIAGLHARSASRVVIFTASSNTRERLVQAKSDGQRHCRQGPVLSPRRGPGDLHPKAPPQGGRGTFGKFGCESPGPRRGGKGLQWRCPPAGASSGAARLDRSLRIRVHRKWNEPELWERTRATEDDGACFAHGNAREVDELVLSYHDLLYQLAVAQLDRLRRVER